MSEFYKEITFVVTEFSYLKDLEVFTRDVIIKNSSKILQMKYLNEENRTNEYNKLRLQLASGFGKEVVRISRKKIGLEEKKVELINWVRETKRQRPELFEEIGWWDLKMRKLRASKADEKEE